MPRKYALSWEGPPHHRWTKMHKGVRYKVVCSQLNIHETEWTKDGSYQLANEWWAKKKVEIDAADLSRLKALEAHDYPQLPDLRERADYHRRHGEDDQAEIIDAEIISIKALPPGKAPVLDTDTAGRITGFEKITGIDLSTVDPVVLDAAFNRKEAVYADRIDRDTSTPPERTVGALADRWLARRQEKADDGKLTIHGASNSEYRIRPLVELIGKSSDPNALTSDLWERFRDRLEGRVRQNNGTGREWAKNQWHAARDFVNWMYTNKSLAELPRNFLSLKLKVGRSGGGNIETFTHEEIKTLWATCRGQQRLHVLLGLNCAFYPWDVSSLTRKNIDQDAGTITHRRSKTKHKTSHAPTVYKLWPETVSLLRQYMTLDGESALVNADGKVWIRYTKKPGGKLSEADGIRQWWDRVVKKSGLPRRPFKTLRMTGASTLGTHTDHERTATHYLANAPNDVTHGHYVRRSDTLLASALDWLRAELGIDKLPTS